MIRDLRCRLGFHRWISRCLYGGYTERCSRCGKVEHVPWMSGGPR